MKKEFVAPVVEFIAIEVDVLCTSTSDCAAELPCEEANN